MKQLTILLLLATLLGGLIADTNAQSTNALSVTLAWDPNSESDLAGYRIYYTINDGVAAPAVIDVGNKTICTITNMLPGTTYIFYATAYNKAGLESAPSESLTWTAPAIPISPKGLKVNVVIRMEITIDQ